MKMFEQFDRVFKILNNDSTLWKLLYYPSTSASDDPLLKPDVLALPASQRSEIRKLRLKKTPVTDDLVEQKICRLVIFPGERTSTTGNYRLANQRMTVEVFVHRDINEMDMRLTKLCDHINDLLNDKRLSALGKSKLIKGDPFFLTQQGYIGYRMTYEFGSGQ